MALQQRKLGWVEALRTQARSIHALIQQHSAEFIRKGCGVGFDSPFGALRKIETRSQSADQAAHFVGRQKRRRATAEKYGTRLEFGRSECPEIGLSKDQIDESGHSLRGLPRDGIEIAIVALVETEGDMHIKGGDGDRREG